MECQCGVELEQSPVCNSIGLTNTLYFFLTSPQTSLICVSRPAATHANLARQLVRVPLGASHASGCAPRRAPSPPSVSRGRSPRRRSARSWPRRASASSLTPHPYPNPNPIPNPNPKPTPNSNPQAGIGIKPAYCFTDVVTPGTDYFRVGYGEASFPRSLEALAAFVHKHRQAWRIRSRL